MSTSLNSKIESMSLSISIPLVQNVKYLGIDAENPLKKL